MLALISYFILTLSSFSQICHHLFCYLLVQYTSCFMSQKYILTLQFFLIENLLIKVFSSGQLQDKKFAKSHDGNIIGEAEAGAGYRKLPYQIYFFKKKNCLLLRFCKRGTHML